MNDQTKSDSVELLPCPLACRASPLPCSDGYKVFCPLCGFEAPINSWNRRPLPPSATAQEAVAGLRSNGTQIMSVGPCAIVGGVERDHLRAGKTFIAIPYRNGYRLDEDDVLLYAPAGQQPVSETAAQGSVPDWKQAVDDALVTSLQCTTDSYTDPKKAINDLICWNIAVATDPRVNGGFQLVPTEPTRAMANAGWNTGALFSDTRMIHDLTAAYCAMLAAAPRSTETEVEDVKDQDMTFARRAAIAIYDMNRDLPERDRLAAVYIAGAKHHAEALDRTRSAVSPEVTK